MNLGNNILTFIILGYVIGGLTSNILPVELENIHSIYAQSNTDETINNNNVSSADIQCFDNPCNPQLDETTGVTDNENSTALIGISFKDVPLKDIQQNKETLKAVLTSYLNATIDAFATGKMVTQTRCVPMDIDIRPTPGDKCPIIDGITIQTPDE